MAFEDSGQSASHFKRQILASNFVGFYGSKYFRAAQARPMKYVKVALMFLMPQWLILDASVVDT